MTYFLPRVVGPSKALELLLEDELELVGTAVDPLVLLAMAKIRENDG